jgi:hypothetical protein
MTSWTALDRFLQTDPQDVGCEQTMEFLHVYVDLMVADAMAAADRYRGITAHLRACEPCREDFEGLLATVGGPEGRRRDFDMEEFVKGLGKEVCSGR